MFYINLIWKCILNRKIDKGKPDEILKKKRNEEPIII